jgi:3-hydroxybutyryl-CoA dehydrogenase
VIAGVVGAGTMGAGIAQLACQAGAETRLLDADASALERARERIAGGIEKAAAKGRADRDAVERLKLVGTVGELAGCDVVIEAIPEDLELKHRVLTEVASVVGDGCVLATNTSSLPVTQVAAGVPGPERVVGMHFFNPAPVMRLVEVIAGVGSSEAAVARVRELGEAMGKRVIEASDGPGFLVNRCGRPFGLEALRCLQEGLAGVETIDRVVRLGGGFRMGPFELQDLVGIDVGFEVSRSFHELSFGEPRWRPSPLQARMAASGRHGRKAGRGWYAYDPDPAHPHRPDDPPAPDTGAGDGLIVVGGDLPLAGELLEAAAEAGWDVTTPEEAEGAVPYLALDCSHDEYAPPLEGGPRARLCAEASLAQLEEDGPAVGFHVLPPLAGTRLVELTRGPSTAPAACEHAERFFASLGKHTAWVGDAPGLVLGRIVCQLVNEAAFALGEGVGDAADIDAGMVLGLNHPRGPLEWADLIGLDHVASVLVGLQALSPEQYRLAPALRRAWSLGLTFHGAGALD